MSSLRRASHVPQRVPTSPSAPNRAAEQAGAAVAADLEVTPGQASVAGEPGERTPAPGAVAGVSPAARPANTRLCALCGEPLRAGQHLIRVHGSTIHTRCLAAGR